jgi:hypothetical protein
MRSPALPQRAAATIPGQPRQGLDSLLLDFYNHSLVALTDKTRSTSLNDEAIRRNHAMNWASVPSDVTTPALVDKVERHGVVCVTDLVPDEWLKTAQSLVANHIAEHGSRDFFDFGPGAGESALVGQLFSASPIGELIDSLAAARRPQAQRAPQVTSCLRVLAGQERDDAPLMHYDNDVVTIVVPVVIPRGELGQSGELLVFPNKRPFRDSMFANLLDKVLTYNPWYRRRAVKAALREPDHHVVDMAPGNAYIFWGYRTFHGNLPCAPDLVRATLILQYGDPHPPGSLLNLMTRRRERRLARWLTTNQAVQPTRRAGTLAFDYRRSGRRSALAAGAFSLAMSSRHTAS